MKISYLIPTDELKEENGLLDSEVENCTADFRKASGKSLLFLLPGVSFDTYTLIDKYVISSPSAIITEDRSKFPDNCLNIIEVKNARKCFSYAMSKISGINYGSLSFIGVTGTNGKTTTATMIHKILCECNVRCALIGTGKIFFDGQDYAPKNYSMTSPDPDVLYPALADMQKRGCEAVVMEASSHALALDKLYPIPFKIGIFTGLSHDHLEFHKNMENYFNAKERLICSSESAIINFDDPYGKKLYEKYKDKSTSVGIIWKCDGTACNVNTDGVRSITYKYMRANASTAVKLSLLGIYNVYNSMLAIEACYKMNVTLKDIKSALENIKVIEGRFEVISGEVTVIIDYAHTPLALESLLKSVISVKNPKQKITLVFGCGGERDRLKRPIMASVAEKFADRVIVTNDNPRGEDENEIIAEIISGFVGSGYGVIKDRRSAIEYAITSSQKNDIVIIAGKGHERYINDKKGIRYFDEREIIKNSLKLRNKV